MEILGSSCIALLALMQSDAVKLMNGEKSNHFSLLMLHQSFQMQMMRAS
jgi:hypothetical protein